MKRYFDIIQKKTQESDRMVNNALKTFLTRSTVKDIETLASKWINLSTNEQVRESRKVSGLFQMLRFMVLMNGLALNKSR